MKCFKSSNIFLLMLSLIQVLPPTFIRLSLSAIIILISLFYSFKVNRFVALPPYIKGLNYLLILFTIYGISLIINSPIIRGYSGNIVSNTSYLTAIYLSLLPIYPIYYFSVKMDLKESEVRLWSIVLLILTTYSFFKLKNELIFLAELNNVYISDVTNNFGYSFLAFIPLIFIFKSKIIVQYFLLFYSLIFILLSMKRGAILIGLICFMIFIVAHKKTLLHTKVKFKFLFLSTICFICLFFVVRYLLLDNDYFQYKLMDLTQGSSGRNDLYSSILDHYFANQNLFPILFGEGANATIILNGNYAHSDWLEILLNQGLLGVIVYLIYWFFFLKTLCLSRNNKVTYYALMMIFISMLFKSFYSMSYAGVYNLEILSLGYFIAQKNVNS